MTKIFAIISILVFVFGIAATGFSLEKGTFVPKHDDMKICANVPENGGDRDASLREVGSSEEWNLTFYESLLRNGIEVPGDRLARAGSEPCMKEETGG